jgi:hypothetical protein
LEGHVTNWAKVFPASTEMSRLAGDDDVSSPIRRIRFEITGISPL